MRTGRSLAACDGACDPMAAVEHQGLSHGRRCGGEIQRQALEFHHQGLVLRAAQITTEGPHQFPGATGLEGGHDVNVWREGESRDRDVQFQAGLAQQRVGQGCHARGTQYHGIEAFGHCEGLGP